MGLVAIIGWLILLAISGLVLFLTYSCWKVKKTCKSKGIPYIAINWTRFFGFVWGSISIPELELLFYADFANNGSKVTGFNDGFVKLSYSINDLELAKHIYIKDFDHFVDRRNLGTAETHQDRNLLHKMLISLNGDHWKGVRSKLSPTFTTGKIRKMFWIFEKSSDRMCDYLKRCVGEDGGDTDICEAYSKYALDVIASCAFGIESEAFNGNIGELSQFEKMTKLLQIKVNLIVIIKSILFMMAPKLTTKLGLNPIDFRVPQDYFRKIVQDVKQQRKESGERKDDFLQLMMDAQEGLLKESKESMEVMSGSEEGSGGLVLDSPKITFDEDDIVANCVLFIIGGFDTTQILLVHATYALALEQEVQERVLKEVTLEMEKNGGKLKYEELHQMQYLDMFINETLRFYPPAARLERMCTKEYKVPGMDLVIDKGSIVSISVLGMHRDPKYYTNPEKFDPERFLPERKAEINPYSFAPFGHGPRNCIGRRFAMTEVKAIIATLVYNFKLEPGKKTDIPMKYQMGSLKPLNGLWLQITPRRKDT